MKYLSRMVMVLSIAFTLCFSGWMAKDAFDQWSLYQLRASTIESIASIIAACEASGKTNCEEKYNGLRFD